MKQSYTGPRRWAVLVLFLGVASASAFLRKSEQAPRPAFATPANGDASLATASSPSDTLPHSRARIVSGTLPSTEFSATPLPTALPDWVTPVSQLDQLINMGATPQSAPSSLSKLGELNTWTGRPLDLSPGANAVTPPQATSFAHRTSPWEGPDGSTTASSTVSAQEPLGSAWPDQKMLVQEVLRRASPPATPTSAGSGAAIGNLVGSNPAANSPVPAQGTQPQAPQSTAPRQRQFVFQPGFQDSGATHGK